MACLAHLSACPVAHVFCLACLHAADLTPPRGARPKTTTAVARRLISNALGNSQVGSWRAVRCASLA